MNDPSRMFRVIIVDASESTRAGIEAGLREDPEIAVVAQCAGGPLAGEAIRQHRPDIVFLEAPRRDAAGPDVLAGWLGPVRPTVVFLRGGGGVEPPAFDAHVVDHLVKPVGRTRLAEALARAKTAVRRDPLQEISRRLDSIWLMLQATQAPAPLPAALPAPASRVREERGRMFIRCGGAIQLVACEDIRWIQTDGDYVRLHTADKAHLVRMPLSRMMLKLDPAQFMRIHRSAAVNLRYLSRATPARFGEYTVDLTNGTKLKVSRTFVRSLKTRL